MRIGIHAGALMLMGSELAEVADHAAQAEADGFSTYWLPQSGATDALTVIATLGAVTSTIEFATAVIPTWGRHPHVLAGQALTVQAATGNRLALGIGVAHKPSVEDRYHVPFERPVRHLREYLDVLQGLLADRTTDLTGEIWSYTGDLVTPPAEAPQVLVAALGPQFLRLTGKRADGTVLWLAGPATVEQHIVPTIADAAAEADRPMPRVVASVPVSVTDRADEVRASISDILVGYDTLPSYRSVLDREGAARAGDVAVIGNEDEVRAGLARFAEAGASDFAAVEFGLDGEEFARTRALLKELQSA
jgi:5,10-methylenetetrahydromethanopterin reductase